MWIKLKLREKAIHPVSFLCFCCCFFLFFWYKCSCPWASRHPSPTIYINIILYVIYAVDSFAVSTTGWCDEAEFDCELDYFFITKVFCSSNTTGFQIFHLLKNDTLLLLWLIRPKLKQLVTNHKILRNPKNRPWQKTLLPTLMQVFEKPNPDLLTNQKGES